MGVLYAVASIKKISANKIKKDDFPEEEQEGEGQPQQQQSFAVRKPLSAQLRRHIDAISQKLDTYNEGQRKPRAVAAAKPKVKIEKPSKRRVRSPYEQTEATETTAASPVSAVMAAAGLHQMDNLRNAVIYHEILGKPVALRNSEKEPAGF